MLRERDKHIVNMSAVEGRVHMALEDLAIRTPT